MSKGMSVLFLGVTELDFYFSGWAAGLRLRLLLVYEYCIYFLYSR